MVQGSGFKLHVSVSQLKGTTVTTMENCIMMHHKWPMGLMNEMDFHYNEMKCRKIEHLMLKLRDGGEGNGRDEIKALRKTVGEVAEERKLLDHYEDRRFN